MGDPGRIPRVTDKEILDVFREADDPALATAEVAGELPIGERATYQRLLSLTETGEVRTKEAGRSRIWWIEAE